MDLSFKGLSINDGKIFKVDMGLKLKIVPDS
jgi:hypothetical protein